MPYLCPIKPLGAATVYPIVDYNPVDFVLVDKIHLPQTEIF